MGYYPNEVKKLLFLLVLINNVLVPLSLLPFFRYRNIISSWSIEERSERIIPLSITTILYAVTSFIIFRYPIPAFLKAFFLSAFLLSLSATVISLWWKISIHSIGTGALIALILLLSLKFESSLDGVLILAVFVAGVVLTSRLKLNSHNPRQVWYGLLAGYMGLWLIMSIF
jgi:hypothetical protein